MNEEKALLWQQRIQEYMSSGLSVKKWCEENGVSRSNFYFWKKRMEKTQAKISDAGMPVFVEVTQNAPLQTDRFCSSVHIT